jgi:large subunit ribosomal protein L25
MEQIQLSARLRSAEGKLNSRRVRRGGEVPCVLYGIEPEVVSLAIKKRELVKLLTSRHSIIVLNYEGKQQQSIIKEIQYHPLKGDIIHMDFQRILAGQEIRIAVPVKFVGVAPGAKTGGIFQELRAHLEVTCLPADIPNYIEVDISALEIGDAIHVSDLKLGTLKIEEDPTTAVCSVAAPKKLEEVVAPVEEGAEEAAEPEVITARKKDEEEEEGEGKEKEKEKEKSKK